MPFILLLFNQVTTAHSKELTDAKKQRSVIEAETNRYGGVKRA